MLRKIVAIVIAIAALCAAVVLVESGIVPAATGIGFGGLTGMLLHKYTS